MDTYDTKSKELEELEDLEEERIREENGGCCPGPVDLFSTSVDRRGFIKVGVGGLLSLMFAQWLDPRMAQAQVNPKKAKACILLWMNGGPSHIDTWDPKPGAATARHRDDRPLPDSSLVSCATHSSSAGSYSRGADRPLGS